MRMLVEMQDWILQQGGNRAEATARMQGLVFHHAMVPVALGLGETSTAQKFTALLHALRLEAEDWRMVGRLAKRIVSFTTDYGVEAGLQSVPPWT